MSRPLAALSIAVSATLLCAAATTARADDPATPTTRPHTTTTRPAATTRASARLDVMQHRLVALDADALLDVGHFYRCTEDPHVGIVLRPATTDWGHNDFPLIGTWTSDTIKTAFGFTELLPSWNASVPDHTGVKFEVRARDKAAQSWSPWLYIGYWGRVTTDDRTHDFAGGKVDCDTLKLSSPADAFEIRATLMEFNAVHAASPGLRKVFAVYSRPMPAAGDHADDDDETSTTKPATRPARIDIPVPYRAQGDNPKSVSGLTCSPTSVSMVLAWAGADKPTVENALAIWDDDNEMFGNWNRAVQYAASLGLDAELRRFSTMDQVRAVLATGQPIVASIQFKPGEFPSNLLPSTEGHLIVIRGYTETGDLIVNDPGNRAHGDGVVYKADELAHAWLVNTGGASYVIHKKP